MALLATLAAGSFAQAGCSGEPFRQSGNNGGAANGGHGGAAAGFGGSSSGASSFGGNSAGRGFDIIPGTPDGLAGDSHGGALSAPSKPACTSAAQCAAASCANGSYTPASECLDGECSAPASTACPFGECGSDGCHKPSLVFAAADDSPLRGNTTTVATSQSCPAGWLLIGVDVNESSSIISRVRLICGAPELSENDPMRLLITQSRELDWIGGGEGTLELGRCPDNQVVVSFAGNSGELLDQLRLHCAELRRDADKLVAAEWSSPPPLGGSGGSAFPTSECPEGSAAAGGVVFVESSAYVSGFGLTCKAPSLEWAL